MFTKTYIKLVQAVCKLCKRFATGCSIAVTINHATSHAKRAYANKRFTNLHILVFMQNRL